MRNRNHTQNTVMLACESGLRKRLIEEEKNMSCKSRDTLKVGCYYKVWGGPLGDCLHVVDGGVGGGQEQGFPRDHNHTQTTVFIHPPHTVLTPCSRESFKHIIRIYTEEKAKVVVASSGAEFLQFLSALAILHQDEVKNFQPIFQLVLVHISLFFNSSWCK